MSDAVKYETSLPSVDDYFDLFNTTGWNEEFKCTTADLAEAIGRSWYSVSAYSDKILVGFGRFIIDGVHHALLADIMVHHDFRAKGIGNTGFMRGPDSGKERMTHPVCSWLIPNS